MEANLIIAKFLMTAAKRMRVESSANPFKFTSLEVCVTLRNNMIGGKLSLIPNKSFVSPILSNSTLNQLIDLNFHVRPEKRFGCLILNPSDFS